MVLRSWQVEPVIEEHAGVSVLRDDLLPGGSKSRFLPFLIGKAEEVVFGGPFCGGAPLALSVVGQELGVRVTLFYAKRNRLHPRQALALSHGATIYQVPFGYMTNVQVKAKRYAESKGALFLPLGFDLPEASAPFVEVMAGVRRKLGSPDQVWCATGSGMLARCLGAAFPESQIMGVAVGLKSRWSKQEFPANVRLIDPGIEFAQETKASAPFPSCPNYDRKAWAICAREHRGRALFWNVLGESIWPRLAASRAAG